MGATLRYLPKYSPDLNPIEMPYSKFKTFLRKVAARTIPSLNRAIRSFIPQLSPQECANYFRHAGYVSISSESALVFVPLAVVLYFLAYPDKFNAFLNWIFGHR